MKMFAKIHPKTSMYNKPLRSASSACREKQCEEENASATPRDSRSFTFITWVLRMEVYMIFTSNMYRCICIFAIEPLYIANKINIWNVHMYLRWAHITAGSVAAIGSDRGKRPAPTYRFPTCVICVNLCAEWETWDSQQEIWLETPRKTIVLFTKTGRHL